jgi:DNA-binding MarR family transcriptional regulator
MVDVNAFAGAAGPSSDEPLELSPEALRRAMELLFYAYRDITAEPDRRLAAYGLGRAHHRAIHFVRRTPGMTVAELLVVLRVTKQSLARVLRQLVDRGLVVQRTDSEDRRRRRLYLTGTGRALENLVSTPQQECLSRAFRAAGPGAANGYRRVLWELLTDADRAALAGNSAGGAEQRK